MAWKIISNRDHNMQVTKRIADYCHSFRLRVTTRKLMDMKRVPFVLFAISASVSQAETQRIPLDLDNPNTGQSFVESVTPDGRFVSLYREDELDYRANAYIYDTVNQTLEKVSIGENGGQYVGTGMSSISADGQKIAFQSAVDLSGHPTGGYGQIFVRDRNSGVTICATLNLEGNAGGNDDSYGGVISGNGNFVAFQTQAWDLVADDTNYYSKIFIRNLTTNTTSHVSLRSSGAQVSAYCRRPTISHDGNLVAFVCEGPMVLGDNNNASDVYVRNVSAGTTTRVSVGPSGEEAEGNSDFPSISADGTLVAFTSQSTTFGQSPLRNRVYVKNLITGALEHISVSVSGGDANGAAGTNPTISADGRFVGFSSEGSNHVAGDSNGIEDLFVRDRVSKLTHRVSVSSTGEQSLYESGFFAPVLVANNGSVFFDSGASDLVAGPNGRTYFFSNSVPTDVIPVVDNSALKATYTAGLAKLSAQIKAAKKKKAKSLVKKLTKKFKKLQGLLNALS